MDNILACFFKYQFCIEYELLAVSECAIILLTV